METLAVPVMVMSNVTQREAPRGLNTGPEPEAAAEVV